MTDPKKIEKRIINMPATVVVRKDGSLGSIYGYPIVYNKDSEDMGYIERIAPGAAKKALKRSDIRGLKNHDPSLIFGRQGVNLTFKEDSKGLRYDATPIDTQNYRETAKEVQLGLLTGQSFGFTILADEWKDLDTDHPKRTITEIGEIYDVGPVTYPAYQDTTAGVRTLEAARKEALEKPLEKLSITLGENIFEFNGDDRFDRAAEKIIELRSGTKPTLPAPDNADADPTVDNPSDADNDDVLEQIEKIEARYQR